MVTRARGTAGELRRGYPHRNELLGRASTAKEVEWLRSKRLPAWALSVRPKFNKARQNSADAVGGHASYALSKLVAGLGSAPLSAF